MIPISDNSKENKEILEEEQTETAKVKEEDTVPSEETAEPEKEAEQEKETKEDKKSKKKDKKPSKEAEELLAEKDKYLRLYAEFDNYKKRSQKEKEGVYTESKVTIVKDFLPVYDNLVRALEQKTEDEAYYKGVEMIMNQFNATLEKLGVKEIPALGEKFNPEVHNAVMHVDDEEKGDNEIVEVFQKGFMIGDKVIRFAMVKVAN